LPLFNLHSLHILAALPGLLRLLHSAIIALNSTTLLAW
jgi:hypothetical protein